MLGPLPDDFHATRAALHAIAQERVMPPRREATGRIDLRATPGGFGTPVFDLDREVRTDGAELVVTGRGRETREPLPGVDDTAARWLGRFFAIALHTLTELARDLPREHAPSAPKLWPEHFDYAIDAGVARANFGFSPGDDEHPEPYLYVGPWDPPSLEVAPFAEVGDPLAWFRERGTRLHV